MSYVTGISLIDEKRISEKLERADNEKKNRTFELKYNNEILQTITFRKLAVLNSWIEWKLLIFKMKYADQRKVKTSEIEATEI
jgi:hypothetical protein